MRRMGVRPRRFFAYRSPLLFMVGAVSLALPILVMVVDSSGPGSDDAAPSAAQGYPTAWSSPFDSSALSHLIASSGIWTLPSTPITAATSTTVVPTASVSLPDISATVPTPTHVTSSVPTTHNSASGPTRATSPAPTTTHVTSPPPTTTVPPTAPLPSIAAAEDVGVSDAHLTLDGLPYTAIGVNAYEIATDWGVDAGCGAMLSNQQLDQFFASLPPNSLVRFWAWQGTTAVNVNTGQIDWAPLDRVFAAAAAYGQRLIPVLAGQGGGCDDGGRWQDPAWYDGGFMQVYNDPALGQGTTPLSYWDYLQAIVNRYKDSPALGMWEPISEAEASTCPPQYEPTNCGGHQTCPDEAAAAQALRYFFDTVGGEIHALDPNHLVEDGLMSNGQCGAINTDWVYVSESPGIDVLSYHDYSDPTVDLPGDQWNGLATRLQEAASIGKPIIGGEMGIGAGTGTGCLTDAQRSADLVSKIDAQIAQGSSGVLPWDWVPSAQSGCSTDIGPTDAFMSALGTIGATG